MNVQKVCWPGDTILDNGTRIKAQWEVFDPRGIDPTTGKLTQLSHMVGLAVLALWVWCVCLSRTYETLARHVY